MYFILDYACENEVSGFHWLLVKMVLYSLWITLAHVQNSEPVRFQNVRLGQEVLATIRVFW